MTELMEGVVIESPADEAKRLNVDVDTLSLARAMVSEERTSGETARVAVGHAVLNHAKSSKISVTKLVTRSKTHPEADGRYSRQDKGKYCTTFDPPTEDSLVLATNIISGSIPDPTGGATLFDNPTSQDLLHKVYPDKWKSSEEIAAKRQAAGYTAINVEGTTTRFWRKG